MATTITQPAGLLQPWKIVRQAIVLAIVVAVGVGAGLLLDSGRSESNEAAALTEAQQGFTAEQRLQRLADSLIVASQPPAVDTRGATYDPAAGGVVYGDTPRDVFSGLTPEQRLESLADSLTVAPQPAAVETRGATYDPAAGGVVFGDATGAGAEAEHGPFTSMTYRDPSVVMERFGGEDANLDPDLPAVDYRTFIE